MLFSLLFSFSLLLAGTASLPASSPPPPPPNAPTPSIGVTYNPSPNLPQPERVAQSLQSLRVSTVRLQDPDPATIRAFSYSNISLLLSVPNSLISSFAANRSAATLWLYNHVLPFHPRARISAISVGSDVISTTSSYDDLIPAMRNLDISLRELGIRTITVSTTFSFTTLMSTSFPPSAAEFQGPINDIIIKPLLQFLDQTNSSFFVNLYPYKVFKLHQEIPIGFALFQEGPFNFRDDLITGVRYRNLFDMMVDAVIAAMAISGHENIPVVVTETGWPSSSGSEPEATPAYSEMYVKGLVSHLKSGAGTPLRKEGAPQTYVYQLFDGVPNANNTNQNGLNWGILYPNMSMKFNVNFSGAGGGGAPAVVVLGGLLAVAVLLLL